jgi:hypothetical protein
MSNFTDTSYAALQIGDEMIDDGKVIFLRRWEDGSVQVGTQMQLERFAGWDSQGRKVYESFERAPRYHSRPASQPVTIRTR